MNQIPINKTYAIISYCTLIGWIVAIIQASSKEENVKHFTAFHLRQMLLLMLIGAAISIISTILFFIPVIGIIGINILSLILFLIWLMLIVSAVRGEKRYIPLVGESGEKMLGDMFE
ncbi:DUF4870 domain-containing protein [Fluviicola taffensis]|uniref:Import component protein n=1 Tax=Fluviicola taffensis (strain DSM 16823 / NCIMB 13979 / RW262) TaxID=755732 RepID=F2IG47_FLUTR|nr:hypothetical protein [Fluviicola taffensis]AEA44682.1 hypothetical protein Fluta_2701 [Fluviicola taffensis DSM 16823]